MITLFKILVGDLKDESVKMKKAKELGIEVTTYATLIKKLKLFKDYESINENYDEVGQLELWWNGEGPSTWFYLKDAILDGIIDEKLQLDGDIIEKFAERLSEMGELDEDSVEWFDGHDLADMIEQDFEKTLHTLFDFLLEIDFIDEEPTVEIKGEDEDGEEHELTYYPEN